MIAFHGMLVAPAKEAGIKVPDVSEEDLETENFDRNAYPHWMVFSRMQLGRPMSSPSSHWDNAKLVAGIDGNRIWLITPSELESLGLK